MSDEALWIAFRQGSLTAFEQVYQRHIKTLFNYGAKLTANRDLVADTIQDLFVDLWRTRANLGPTDNIKYYLFKALRRRLVKSLQPTPPPPGQELELTGLFELIPSPEAQLIGEQEGQLREARLQKALRHLTPRQREAIFLKYYQNLSFAEVAEVMSLGLKSTYNLVEKSVGILRAYLKNQAFLYLVLGSMVAQLA
ncbi:MAG: sigma-70 family RNA polymerase sigma factor [Bernardetiaceae bacterium]|nr:sigma-70 family RNA polymerase sigma factor [Bernardetiaceae bacterium]